MIYGIAVRAPESFCEGLSAELIGRLPDIVKTIATHELREQAS